MKLFFMQSSPVPYHFPPLGSKYSLKHPVFKIPNLCYSLNVTEQVSQLHARRSTFIVLYVLICKVWERRREDKDSEMNSSMHSLNLIFSLFLH
jgi:hypothetical protein